MRVLLLLYRKVKPAFPESPPSVVIFFEKILKTY